MSNLELYIVICALIMPVVALILIKPKFIKKSKTKAVKAEVKKEEPKVETEIKEVEAPKVEEKEIKTPVLDEDLFSPDDFNDYLNKRQEQISKPIEKIPEADVSFSFEEFLARRNKKENEEQGPKTFNELPEDVQMMILTGILDKKYFD